MNGPSCHNTERNVLKHNRGHAPGMKRNPQITSMRLNSTGGKETTPINFSFKF